MTATNFSRVSVNQLIAIKDFSGDVFHIGKIESINATYFTVDGVRFYLKTGTALCNQKSDSWVSVPAISTVSSKASARLQDNAARAIPFDINEIKTNTTFQRVFACIDSSLETNLINVEKAIEAKMLEMGIEGGETSQLNILDRSITFTVKHSVSETLTQYINRTYRAPKLNKLKKSRSYYHSAVTSKSTEESTRIAA